MRYFTLSSNAQALRRGVISCAIGGCATRANNKGSHMAAYEFTVSVSTQYLEEQSDPERSSYVFAYAITIKNTGQLAAQLISRHWVITDANNRVEEVRGL